MDEEFIADLIKDGKLRWQRHALQRMMERDIFGSDVKSILLEGEVIEEYPDDQPFPSGLFLGFINERPVHVVVAVDKVAEWLYIITAYQPDSEKFMSDYKTRK